MTNGVRWVFALALGACSSTGGGTGTHPGTDSSSGGAAGADSAIAGATACQQATAIEHQLLAARDTDAQSGLISPYEAPCNFSAQAKAKLNADRLKTYAAMCLAYERMANACNGSAPRVDGGR